MEGALATPTSPLVARGRWLHIYLKKDNGKTMLREFGLLQQQLVGQSPLPLTLEWRELKLKLTVIQ